MNRENVESVPLRVLSLENSPLDTGKIRTLLTEVGYDLAMDCAENKDEFTSLLRSHTYDVILSDFTLPNFDEFGALKLSIDICPDTPFICVSGSIGEETAIELMKQGAVDCVPKDRIAKLPFAIQRALDEVEKEKWRLKVEQTLRQSEERYRALVTFSPDAFYVHVDGRVTLVNPALCRLLGAADATQLIGKSVFEIVHSEYHEQVRNRWKLIFDGHSAPPLEEKFKRLDGSFVDVEVRAVAIDWQGSTGVQVIARDIAERKRAEEEVRDSEERFRMVFEHVFDGISIYREDPDPSKRRLIECNERYAIMAGRSREELLQLGSTQALQITHESTANGARLESLAGGTSYRGSFSWIRPDGKDNVIEYVGTPITWRGEAYSIGIDRDITEWKRAEELLTASAKEKGMLLKEIYHRVNNNLQVISSLLSLQGDQVRDERFKGLLRESQHRVRAMALVHERLYRSHNLASIDFGDYLRSVTRELFQAFGHSGVALSLDVESIPLQIDLAVPSGLIVNELVTNAFKYAFPENRQGCVTVALHRRNETMLELNVRDNGVGLPHGLDIKKVSSMGLTLVNDLVDQINGAIIVEEGSGTSVRIQFPA